MYSGPLVCLIRAAWTASASVSVSCISSSSSHSATLPWRLVVAERREKKLCTCLEVSQSQGAKHGLHSHLLPGACPLPLAVDLLWCHFVVLPWRYLQGTSLLPWKTCWRPHRKIWDFILFKFYERERTDRKCTAEAVAKQMETEVWMFSHKEFMRAAQITGLWMRLASSSKQHHQAAELAQ